VTRLVFGFKDLLFGGAADVETILVRGERLPSWTEIGFATLDVTIVGGAVGVVAKAARLGAGTAEAVGISSIRLAGQGATGKSTIRLAAEGAYAGISTVGKAGMLAAPAAFVYVAITRPQLIASAGGWIAEQLGGNRLIGIFAVFLIGVFLVLQFLRPVFWCGRIVMGSASRLANYSHSRAAA
jgi:hypothetical protein